MKLEGQTQQERDAESDEIVAMLYEEGLETEEPWAVEAYEYRHPEAR